MKFRGEGGQGIPLVPFRVNPLLHIVSAEQSNEIITQFCPGSDGRAGQGGLADPVLVHGSHAEPERFSLSQIKECKPWGICWRIQVHHLPGVAAYERLEQKGDDLQLLL